MAEEKEDARQMVNSEFTGPGVIARASSHGLTEFFDISGAEDTIFETEAEHQEVELPSLLGESRMGEVSRAVERSIGFLADAFPSTGTSVEEGPAAPDPVKPR